MAGLWGSPQGWTLALAIAFGFSGFAVAIYTSKPEWAVPFLTAVLIIVTYWYASSSQRLVESYEKDRKRHVVVGMAQAIFFPMRNRLNEWERMVEEGAFLSQVIYDEKRGNEGSITLIPPINNPLRQLPHTPDRVLKGYLEEIEKSYSDYNKAVSRFKQFLKPISKKRRALGVGFDNFCKMLKSNYSPPDIEAIFAFTIAGGEISHWNPNEGYYKDTMNHLRALLREESFDVDMEAYQHEKKAIIFAIKNLETILDRLLSDWREEYDLDPGDYSLSPVRS